MNKVTINSIDDIFDIKNRLKFVAVENNGKFVNGFEADYKDKENILNPGVIPDHHAEVITIYFKEKYDLIFPIKHQIDIYKKANELGIMFVTDATEYRINSSDRQCVIFIPSVFTEAHKNYLNFTKDIMMKVYGDNNIFLIFMKHFNKNNPPIISYSTFMNKINNHEVINKIN